MDRGFKEGGNMKYEIIYDEEKNEIKYGDTVLCGWDNDANQHDTEELIWRRDVLELIQRSFKAGYEARQNEEN